MSALIYKNTPSEGLIGDVKKGYIKELRPYPNIYNYNKRYLYVDNKRYVFDTEQEVKDVYEMAYQYLNYLKRNG